VILCGAYPKGKKATMWTRITYSHVFYGDVVSGEEYNLILGGLDTFSIGSYSGILPGNRK
jgi:hypothetical protein